MEQHNLKDRLQKMEVRPFDESWEKLSEELYAFEIRKRRRKGMIRYAVSILILVSAGFYFMDRNEQSNETDVIASPKDEIRFEKLPEINEVQEVITSVPVDVEEMVPIDKQAEVRNSVAVRDRKRADDKTESDLSKLMVTGEEEVEEKYNEPAVKKIADAGIEVETTKVEGADRVLTLSAEIDKLLNSALRKVSTEETKMTGTAINSISLLNEVEDELDKDLKEQLLEAIKKSLKNPKNTITSNHK